MQRTDRDEASDEIAEAQKGYLRECALLLLGAVGVGESFPGDRDGLRALIEGTAEPEPGFNGRRFDIESPDDPLDRPMENLVWVSLTKDGELRLRRSQGLHFSLAVHLRPDGGLSQFLELEETAALEPQLGEDSEALHSNDEMQFGNEQLVGVRSPARNDVGRVSVTWVAFYDTGVIVHYLVPNGDEGGEGLMELSDDLGTNYSPVGIGDVDLAVPALRSLKFAPAVPSDASVLTIAGSGGSVEVPVAE